MKLNKIIPIIVTASIMPIIPAMALTSCHEGESQIHVQPIEDQTFISKSTSALPSKYWNNKWTSKENSLFKLLDEKGNIISDVGWDTSTVIFFKPSESFYVLTMTITQNNGIGSLTIDENSTGWLSGDEMRQSYFQVNVSAIYKEKTYNTSFKIFPLNPFLE